MEVSTPALHDAIAIVQRVLHTDVAYVEHFATGLAHFVYDVRTTDDQALVVRLTRPTQRWMFESAHRWYQELTPLGVPLPKLLYVGLTEAYTFPVMLMERLPGMDLGLIYPRLSRTNKQQLAHDLAAIQRSVGSMPLGAGFGYATAYDDPCLQRSWIDVLMASLDRSYERIVSVGIVDPQHVERVRDRLASFTEDLAAIEPRCFLDDITTKNVIVHNGALSGIVDVDSACFGDPLFTVALTRMSLLSSGWDTDYIDEWCAALEVTPTQRRLLILYTAIFCVDFLSEQGQQFNQDTPPAINIGKIEHLLRLLNTLLAEIDGV